MRIPFANRRRTRQEALAWLARLKRGLRQDEGPELLAWLGKRSHRTLIAKAAVEWHGPEVLAVLSELFPIDPAILEPRRGLRPATMIAAAVISLCITLIPIELGWLSHLGLLHHQDPWITATPDATRHVTLDDGTHVALNRGTSISVIYLEHLRSVFVARGEALFAVVSAPYRPFDVRAAGRDFETTSATFDIRVTAPDRLSLTVLAGSVTVIPARPRERPDGTFEYDADASTYKPVIVEPLHRLVIEPDHQFGRALTRQDLRARLAWQRGI